MSTIAVDLGSSHLKGVVVLDDGTFAHEPISWRMPPPEPGRPDEHLVDAESILAAVSKLVAQLARHSSVPTDIRLAGQTGSYVLIAEGDSGPALFHSWQDTRGERPADDSGARSSELLLELLGPDWRTRAGVFMKPGLPVSNLWYDLRHGDLPPGARLLTLGGYLCNRWCGAWAVEVTQAATTGLFDTSTMQWHEGVVEALEHRVVMPQLVSHSEPVGSAVFGGHRLDIYPEVGDHHAGVLAAMRESGTGLDEPAVTITIGTAGLAARAVSERRDWTDREVRPFFGSGWLETATRQPSGRHLAGLAQAVSDQVEGICGTPPDPDRLWAAVTSMVLDLGVADHFGSRYRAAAAQLLGGATLQRTMYTGGVLLRNGLLRSRIDAALGAPSTLVGREATLAGLAVLATSHAA